MADAVNNHSPPLSRLCTLATLTMVKGKDSEWSKGGLEEEKTGN